MEIQGDNGKYYALYSVHNADEKVKGLPRKKAVGIIAAIAERQNPGAKTYKVSWIADSREDLELK